MDYHYLLNKQIQKQLPPEYLEDEVIKQFLTTINNSYNNFDKAKKLADHAFQISEQEYQQVTANLHDQNELKLKSIWQLKEAIKALDPDSTFNISETDDDMMNVIGFLQEKITKAKELEIELIHAKDVAEKAAMAKSQFLSVMSHEIRTPMNAVIGFTHLLLQQDPKPSQMEFLRLLKFSAENLLVLINDILDFSKIEAGKLEFENVDFNLKDLIANIRLSLLQKANEKNIQLKLMIDQDLPDAVIGDPVRLGQILTNLVTNAIKFTETGKVTISATLSSTDKDNAVIDFEVTDTGIGIPKDKQTDIFNSFTQASSDTTRKYGGTGLGLTITRRLLQLLESDIYVDSELGKGSKFHFSLSFKNSAVKLKSNLYTDENIKQKSLQGTRILIAEDNQINVILARQFMKQWQIDCDVAENGEIALLLVQTNDYDMILMDLQMPEMDGYQTTEAIRNLPDAKYQKLPIIALTASAMLDIKDRAFTVGMNDYISKPFNPNELYKKIASYSGNRQSA